MKVHCSKGKGWTGFKKNDNFLLNYPVSESLEAKTVIDNKIWLNRATLKGSKNVMMKIYKK